ncbi:integrase [Luteimonas sp. TWI662]|uniref:site-specific integrase n=1 Tax=Luteimonas sp. TWI662 TaxID=3136789 RepID=UPI0032083992
MPAGIFWDRTGSGRWFVRELGPDGRVRSKTVAGREARLSDLHAIAEDRAGAAAQGSIAHVIDRFHDHREFKDLAASTRDRYSEHARGIKAFETKRGPLGTVRIDALSQPYLRALVDLIAEGRPARGAEPAVPGYPSKANQWLRYLRRVFSFGVEYGLCRTNPARGVRQVKEVRNHRMPTRQAFRRVYEYARACGALGPREKGRQPPYIWCAMELAFQARLRRVEVLTLTDAQIIEALADADADAAQLLEARRRKGSRANHVRIGERMREAVAALQARREAIWTSRDIPTPIRPEQRPLFVTEDGTPLSVEGWKTAWGKMMRAAVADGVITTEERFGLHGLKHRGITDTKGTRADKKEASGHVTDSMSSLYDHGLPTVEPADDDRNAR